MVVISWIVHRSNFRPGVYTKTLRTSRGLTSVQHLPKIINSYNKIFCWKFLYWNKFVLSMQCLHRQTEYFWENRENIRTRVSRCLQICATLIKSELKRTKDKILIISFRLWYLEFRIIKQVFLWNFMHYSDWKVAVSNSCFSIWQVKNHGII